MSQDLTVLFSPKSITVIGASRSPEKVGAIVLKNILNSKFTGQIYPVNPNAESINELKCYPDVKSLPENIDLAIIALPAVLVIETLTQIGDKGIKNAVVFAAGFKESGAEGEKLEQTLTETAKKFGINLLGPNCLGYVNNLCPVNATFGQPVNQSGNLRFISQSGALAASVFDWCTSSGLGFNHFITLGNKAVINENAVLEYFADQPRNSNPENEPTARPVGLYLESITNGTEFLRITSQISQTDPIFIIKPGKTSAAAKAMQSHTGAIAGEDAVLDAALNQAGVIRCETLEDFFDYSRAFAWEHIPAGPRVAIISNAGGPGVISADAVIAEGLQMAEFDSQITEQLAKALPRQASLMNPVDILGDALADRYTSAAETILRTNQADALVIILTPQVMTQIEQTAELIVDLAKKYRTPIFCSFMGGSLVSEGENKLNEYHIPSFRFPDRAIAAIGAMWRWKKQLEERKTYVESQPLAIQLDTNKIKETIDTAVRENQKTLDNLEANQMLQAAGILTPETAEINTLEELRSFAQNYGWPLVLKLSSPGLLHKADIGGVITDILNQNHLELAWDNLQRKITTLTPEIREHVHIQIQKEITDGVEVIVGVKRDPTFGPVMLFGAGGRFAELISDRNLHLLPIDMDQAKRLVERAKIYTILKGYRGEPANALDKLYELMVKLGKLAESTSEVSEIEINPVIVTLNDAWAVDGKVVLKQGETKPIVSSKFHIATTANHTVLAGKYHYFEFETEIPMVYKPGQYIGVKVADTRINDYSIAGNDGQNRFSLLVDISPGGPGSKFFENLKEGDKITYLGPFGVFTFKPDDCAKQVLFLGTGSGCSPLRCMIEAALKNNECQAPINLYFGLRYPLDVFWQDYFQKLALEHPNFNFKTVISKPDQTWQGLAGHITDFVKQDFPDMKECSAYICGNKLMIEEAEALLAEHGCPKERIYSEKF